MTTIPQPQTQQQQKKFNATRWAIIIFLILIACAAIAIAVNALIEQIREPSAVNVARREETLKDVSFFANLKRITLGISVAGGLVLLFGWGWKRVTTTYPKDGLFPLIHRPVIRYTSPPWLKWIGQRLLGGWSIGSLLMDPNRNTTSIIEIRRDGKIQFTHPDQVSAAQMQATMGAQLIQATAAEASGTKVLAAGRSSTRGRNVLGQAPDLVIYNRQQPPITQLPIPDSHIEQLLVEQGQLIPQEIVEQGKETI